MIIQFCNEALQNYNYFIIINLLFHYAFLQNTTFKISQSILLYKTKRYKKVDVSIDQIDWLQFLLKN